MNNKLSASSVESMIASSKEELKSYGIETNSSTVLNKSNDLKNIHSVTQSDIVIHNYYAKGCTKIDIQFARTRVQDGYKYHKRNKKRK